MKLDKKQELARIPGPDGHASDNWDEAVFTDGSTAGQLQAAGIPTFLRR